MAKRTKTRRAAKVSASFQGELGAFSHSASRKLLGESVEVLPLPRFEDVFQALKSGKVTHAVIPIENTLHGSVHENYDHLLSFGLPIVGEASIRISHQLIAMPGVTFKQVRQVFSHPVALNQCLDFFQTNPQIEKKPYYDTAGSVKMLSEQKPEGAAAIASAAAAEIYHGKILKRDIEDDRRNFTRFFLLSRKPVKPNGEGAGWKTSVVFSLANEPGALFKAMSCFALREINLTKIESRPLRGKPWEYLFYVDLVGHTNEAKVEKALGQLGEITSFLRILGSYRPTI